MKYALLLVGLVAWGACPQPLEAGQRPARRLPLPAPVLPAEQGWEVALLSAPSAPGVLDDDRVYVPLEKGEIVALDRETGDAVWSIPHETMWPPAVANGTVLSIGTGGLRAIDAATGAQRWATPLNGDAMSGPAIQGSLVLVVMRPVELRAFNLADGRELWRQALGSPSDTVAIASDAAAACISLGNRLVHISLSDGSILWQRELPGQLGQPLIAGGRVFVGSTDNNFYAFDARTGRPAWKWSTGGDVVGAGTDGELLYMASLDHLLRALRPNGNQVWKRELTTRTVTPPATSGGVVVVVGNAPTLSTFDAKTGAPIATFTSPADLQDLPLVDLKLTPFRVAIVLITRDGRAIGLRPTGMLFREAPLAPLQALPGRPLTREPLPIPPAPSPP